MLKPLEEFYCDTCDQLIDSPSEGMVEWIKATDEPAHSFNIVHHMPHSPRVDSDVPRSVEPRLQGCYQHHDKPNRSDVGLSRFVGEEGLVMLLYFIDIGPYHNPNYDGIDFEDGREFTELFRRVQLPYYEEARRYWGKAERDGFFDDSNEMWIYQPDVLKEVVKRYASRGT